ncbi:MAG TPA: nucleotidyltransferase [Thermoanaerobaculia bacterium]
MARIQKQFEEFHDAIKLRRFGQNATLREKRDIIHLKLRERLPEVFENNDEECPAYSFRDQGSYEMGTGTIPLDGDFDIDQGMYFKVSTSDYTDPVVLKKRVYEALEGHTSSIRIRRSCVTVQYQCKGEPIYHVDLAIYSDSNCNVDGKDRLAVGRTNSSEEDRHWEVSDPQHLSDTILGRFSDEDRKQFRRVVRYLKRWRDENFSTTGNAAPIGIGITVATYDNLQPTYEDVLAGKPDDLSGLRHLAATLLDRFRTVWDDEEQQSTRRLTVNLPVEPWNDLFERMTNRQMEGLEFKLNRLREALNYAASVADPVDACKELQKVFGDDFPIPEKKETAKAHAPAIVSSSSSA